MYLHAEVKNRKKYSEMIAPGEYSLNGAISAIYEVLHEGQCCFKRRLLIDAADMNFRNSEKEKREYVRFTASILSNIVLPIRLKEM